MVKFIHTSDWHLGSRRSILGAEAQALYTEDGYRAIALMGEIARQVGAEFIVVCGDVFESNLVDSKTVQRACEAMAQAKVRIFLLPGNHDPMDASSPYSREDFKRSKPVNVQVIVDSEPVNVADNVELIGAPWMTKRALKDLANEAVVGLDPKPGVRRILAAHGAVSTMSMGREDPSIIDLKRLEENIISNGVAYVALGDRHSSEYFGESGHVWYSGSLQATSFKEVDAGNVLVVDIDDNVSVTKQRITSWCFKEEEFVFNDDTDLALLDSKLASYQNKATTVLRLRLTGTISIKGMGALDDMLENHRNIFAALEEAERGVAIKVDDAVMRGEFSGFTLTTYDRLVEVARSPGPEAAKAKDALTLLYRLSGGCAQ